MSHLNQIIDLRAPVDMGFSNARPIDTGIGLHFDIVFDHGWTGLRDLLPVTRIIFGEAKSIGTHY